MSVFKRVVDAIQGKAPFDHTRDPRWQKVRNAFLKRYSECAVCGSTKNLEVHHIIPFHIAPEHELEVNNLITLCENSSNGVNCHLFFGHLGNYKSYNKDVTKDAEIWKGKLCQKKN